MSDDALYLHASKLGKKLDIINVNPQVCFEMKYKAEISPAPTSCVWSMKYYSSIGWGNASLIADAGNKTKALNLLI